MGDGSGDLQSVWHNFVAGLFRDCSILDLGAGVGRSKNRLAGSGNTVTTQDTERSRMLCVDMICRPEEVVGLWDVVTSFDVIEHASCPSTFLREQWRLARRAIFFTTANVEVIRHPWHFTLDQLREMARPYTSPKSIHVRLKNSEGEWIELLSESNFSVAREFGLLLEKTT